MTLLFSACFFVYFAIAAGMMSDVITSQAGAVSDPAAFLLGVLGGLSLMFGIHCLTTWIREIRDPHFY